MDNTVKDLIIDKVKIIFANDFSGHDFSHTERVYNNAINISSTIDCNKDIVILASLLHDVDDPKLFSTTDNTNARSIMKCAHISDNIINEVINIINKISFKGNGKDVPDSIEGKIVQDADRLDAIGAIGIARAFAYGGSHNRKMYDPNIVPVYNMGENTYHNNSGTTINHFYEKLLLLENLMNTDIAKKIAKKRTKIMIDFIEEFKSEWQGKIN